MSEFQAEKARAVQTGDAVSKNLSEGSETNTHGAANSACWSERDEGPRLLPLPQSKEPAPRLDQYLKLADIALQEGKK
jgi:hypothetical protein